MTIPYYIYDLLEGDGYRWNFNAGAPGTPVTITWAFLGAGTGVHGDAIAPLNASQQQAVETALAYIAQFCGVTFVQTADSSSANITFGFDTTQTGGNGEAGITYWNLVSTNSGPFFLNQSTIYLNNIASNADLTPGFLTNASIDGGMAEGGFGWLTLLHEIGHALGLKHPFDENDVSDPASVLDTTHPSEDDHLHSVMAYQDGPDGGYLDNSVVPNLIRQFEPRTYGAFDIAALQYLYGASAATSLSVLQSIYNASGDSVSGSAGAFTYTFVPSTAVIETICDGGTQDTLNFSSFAHACTISLVPGSFSSLGITVDAVPFPSIDPVSPPQPLAEYNGLNTLSIAYGTTVSACILGSGNDTIIGNDANDFYQGGTGTNTIQGGAGVNTAIYAGTRASYAIGFSNGAVTVTGNGSEDTLTRVQYLQFSDGTTKVRHPAASFDGNGRSDVLFQNADGQAAIWFVNGTTQTSASRAGFNPGSPWHLTGAGDFDGDGKADLVFQNTDGQAAIWSMNGVTPITALRVGGNPGVAWHIDGNGDFNGDGEADLLFQNDDGQAAVWLMNATTVTSASRVGGNPGAAWHIKCVGDFDGDGKADILWQNDDGQAAVWLMNGTTVMSAARVGGNPGPAWQIVGTGDFNGDGESDILWQNSDGQAAIWLMDGTTVTSAARVGGNPGTDWTLIGAGDYNGDGKSDLVWQNSDGQAAIWLISGLTVTAAARVGGNPGTEWHVIGVPGA